MTARIIPVSDPSDPRIADYVAIRERDLTGRDGKFIVEGRVTLEVFLNRSAHRPESLFLEEGRLEPLKETIDTILDDIPIYTAPQSLMDQVVGFPIHRGVLACGLKADQIELDAFISGQPRSSSTWVVGLGLSNHDNVGALIRNAAALGASGVILDAKSCDPLYRKAIRVSAGTALWFPIHYGAQTQDILSALDRHNIEIWALTPNTRAQSLYKLPRPEQCALLLGAEGPGLPEPIIDAYTPVSIPMSNDVDSLNVATSAAIVLSHLNALRIGN